MLNGFKDRLRQARAEQEAQAVEMEFTGFPCKVIPMPLSVWIRSGRMPDAMTSKYLAAASSGDDESAPLLTPEETLEATAFRRTAVCRVMVEPRILFGADYDAAALRLEQRRAEIEKEKAVALAHAETSEAREAALTRYAEQMDALGSLYSYTEIVEIAPAFVGAVFDWISVGCPLPEKGGESEALGADALAKFSDEKRGSKRARARATGKGRGKKAVRANAAD